MRSVTLQVQASADLGQTRETSQQQAPETITKTHRTTK